MSSLVGLRISSLAAAISKSPRRQTLLKPIFAALLVLTVAPPAFAQAAAGALWGRLDVPGTPAALAWAAGLEPQARSLTPEWVLLEVIRAVHGEPDAPALRGLQDYLRLINRYEAGRRALGDRVSLAMAADRGSRDAVERFLRSAGLGLARSGRGAPEQVVRRPHEESEADRALLIVAGVALEGLDARLNAGEEVDTAALAMPWFAVPLPMYPEWWAATLPPGADTFTTIATDRRAALLFYGLASLDAETRRFLAETPQLVPVLLERASVFAAYGGHFRVRNGRVDLPGGAEALAWWEALVGAAAAVPDQFIARALDAYSGRLAYFYALLDSLDTPHVRFATGLSMPPATRPADVFEWFARGEPGFDPERRPFSRPIGDPALFLTELSLDAAGRPIGPAWRYLWDAVFDDLRVPADAARVLRPTAATVDAPYWFSAAFGEGSADPRVRMNTVLFAQRVFSGASEERAPDLLIALRGFQRFPMLCLSLERAGVTAPSAYRAAVELAARLSGIEDSHQAFTSLSQFQGALALIEFGARTGKIDAARAAALVESLASVPLDRRGSFGGDIARWLDSVFVPAVSTALPSSGAAPVERALLAGLANLPEVVDPADVHSRGPTFEWQGSQYHVDPSRAAFTRATAIRQRQAGNTLDALLRLSRLTAVLSAEVALEDVPAHAAALRELLGELREPQPPVAIVGPRPLDVATAVGHAAQDLGRVTQPRHARNVARVAARLHLLTAALTADLLRALAYAVNVPDAQSALFAAGDVSHQHDLGVEAVASAREGIAWGFPERQQGGPGSVRARGSLLGLDIAMADLALGQTFLDRFELPANWTFEDVRIYVQPLALFNPFDPRLAATPEVASAIREGRQRLAEARASRADPGPALKAAGVPPLRQAIVGWALEHAPAGVEQQLSRAELLALGHTAGASRAAAAWGMSTLVLDGCLCLAIDPRAPWDLYSARQGRWGFLGARSPDLPLAIAEALDALRVPPPAAADVLPVAVQAMLRRTRLAHVDDWLSAVRDAALSVEDVAPLLSSALVGRSIYPAAR